jgi:hypothetical protein
VRHIDHAASPIDQLEEIMNVNRRGIHVRLAAVLAVALLTIAGCAMFGTSAGKVTLSGNNEVPPNRSDATGTSAIVIGADKSVSGSVWVSGMMPTAAHVHEAAPGKNGPVIVPFTKSGDAWVPAAGAKLTDAQYASYLAGNLYVNVHSSTYPGGEVRGQLTAK